MSLWNGMSGILIHERARYAGKCSWCGDGGADRDADTRTDADTDTRTDADARTGADADARTGAGAG